MCSLVSAGRTKPPERKTTNHAEHDTQVGTFHNGLGGSVRATTGPAGAGPADKGGEKVDVIIQFNEAPGQSHFNSVNSGELKRRLPAIDGAVFSMPVKALKGLAHNPRIKFISPDREVFASLDYAVPAVGGDLAQLYGWDGDGIGIAIIDSGVEPNTTVTSTRSSTRRAFSVGTATTSMATARTWPVSPREQAKVTRV